MNLEFRKVTSGPFTGATVVRSIPPDRPDEETILRQYLAQQLQQATKPLTYRACNTLEEMVQAEREGVDMPYLVGRGTLGKEAVRALRAETPFFDRDSILKAMAAAESNGGWGERYADFRPQAQQDIPETGTYAEEATTAPDRVAPFEIGDVVRLNSGSPDMTVEDVEHCAACGRWFIDTVWWNGPESEFDTLVGADSDLFTMA